MCRAHAGLGGGGAITMYYVLVAGLRVVFERSWPGSILGSADFVRARAWCWGNFCISSKNADLCLEVSLALLDSIYRESLNIIKSAKPESLYVYLQV